MLEKTCGAKGTTAQTGTEMTTQHAFVIMQRSGRGVEEDRRRSTFAEVSSISWPCMMSTFIARSDDGLLSSAREHTPHLGWSGIQVVQSHREQAALAEINTKSSTGTLGSSLKCWKSKCIVLMGLLVKPLSLSEVMTSQNYWRPSTVQVLLLVVLLGKINRSHTATGWFQSCTEITFTSID